jgi:YegS/Rv2252/BmrU family lipid kinase
VIAPVQVIVNRRAGSTADQEMRTLKAAAAAVGGDLQVVPCDGGEEIATHARRAIASGARAVVAAGGDGTVNSVAAVLAGTDVAMGILPMGTLNHFAKDVGIPGDLDAAIRTVLGGRTTTVDVGQVNGRVFINNSGLGLYPGMVHEREARQRRGARKWPAALVASMMVLAQFRMLRLRVEVEGHRLLRRTPAVFVGNNEYHLDLGVEPKRTTLRDGTLCLYIPRVRRPLPFLLFSLRALFGRPRRGESLDMFLADSFTIESRHRYLRVSIDGEVELMRTPLEYRSWPHALRVLVPVAS